MTRHDDAAATNFGGWFAEPELEMIEKLIEIAESHQFGVDDYEDFDSNASNTLKDIRRSIAWARNHR